MKDDQLINKKFHILQRKKILKDKDKFIYNEIANRITQCIEGINLDIKNCLEIGYASNKIDKYIKEKFKDINYTIADISDKILNNLLIDKKKIFFDHDNWSINKDSFDIIISNFYLHNSNNLEVLLKNIMRSLNSNGFFIASLPSINCFKEIKHSMILADIELYGGAYRRFTEFYSIEFISNLLKINNFKIPFIERDTLELRYKNFFSLINDIRNLGNSYIYMDRKKKFEHKKYFKKVEEIYWKNFSQNNEIFLQIEIIYISGWKEHHSQQKPLKPGEAKFSLKKILE